MEIRNDNSRIASKPGGQNESLPQFKAMEINKGQNSQDSDVDSGIVAYGKSGQRIGSTSSTDTESSQESRQKSEYCSPLPKCDLRTNGIHLRAIRRENCPVPATGPVKADHSVLKECNRRPPTPLTVFPGTYPSVRFDEQLQLSEQNLRRSCRKLFATLYSQRFAYPSEDPIPTPQTTQNGDLHFFRARSKTLPEQELRRHCEKFKDGSVDSTHLERNAEEVNKENLANSSRKVVSWNLKNSSSKTMEQKSLGNYNLINKISTTPDFQQRNLAFAGQSKLDHCCSFKTSVDSGLGLCRSKCTCHNSARSSGESSSQSSTSSSTNHYVTPDSSSTNRYVIPDSSVTPQAAENRGSLVKSNSCSKLSNILQSGQKTPQDMAARPPLPPPAQSPASNCSYSVPLHKTSSCSSIIDSAQVYNVPVYNDSMLHVYAEVASVVPDEPVGKESYNARNGKSNHLYDTVKSPPMSVFSPSSTPLSVYSKSDPSLQSYHTSKRNSSSSIYSCKNSKESCLPNQTKDDVIHRPDTPSDTYASVDCRLVPYRNRSYRESCHSSIASVKPTSVASVRPHSGVPNGYLKSALKSTRKTISQPNVAQNSISDDNRPISEVEYAVVDKSKKNRYTRSLPTLNRFSSNGCITDDEKSEPPIPPKKNLHKSDFAIYKGQSSKKSFFEKVHVLTKNAREAIQKTFSTERIYRPEQEERLEATGQKLTRSKSFIKGLRASISRKRKKIKPPLAEVVPQASSNPVWDEQPSGPNSPVHVRGQLLQLNLDGSQVIELSKPPNKPYGFFVARGRVRNSKGVFVSRMRDQETQKQLAGLLDIGDEILEIEGLGVKDADIMQVNDLMSNKNTLLLTVLPYICRKDI